MSWHAIITLLIVFMQGLRCHREQNKLTSLSVGKGELFYTVSIPNDWADLLIPLFRFSILPAISLDVVLHIDIITGPWTSEDFQEHIETLLNKMNPYLLKNSVLVMDNASQHHFEGIQEMVEERLVFLISFPSINIADVIYKSSDMRLVYLPPYSPDFNPIEEGFSAIKAWIRRHQELSLAYLTKGMPMSIHPYKLLWDAVYETMSVENIQGWLLRP